MSIMVAEVYEALISAGAPEDKAGPRQPPAPSPRI